MIDRVARFLQREFFGQVHAGKFLVAVMERFGSFWMFDQREIALPITVRQLMHLHFDFDAFVNGLNHAPTLRFPVLEVQNKVGTIRI